MPHLLAATTAADHGKSSRDSSRNRARAEVSEHKSMWNRLNLQKFASWLKRVEEDKAGKQGAGGVDGVGGVSGGGDGRETREATPKNNGRPFSSGGLLSRRGSRKAAPGLPRPLTFKRMNSEKRGRQLQALPEPEQRRASLTDRKSSSAKRSLSPPPISVPSVSAPDMLSLYTNNDDDQQRQEKKREKELELTKALEREREQQERERQERERQEREQIEREQKDMEKKEKERKEQERKEQDRKEQEKKEMEQQEREHQRQKREKHTIGGGPDSNIPAGARQVDYGSRESIDYMSTDEPPHNVADVHSELDSHASASDIDDIQLQEELEAKWILNLSMHFRDMTDREKFFITYAEEPNKWRRVTVSCDYRRLEPGSLESDLKSLHYQRDKSSRIYEAIRDSLLDIQFYETVTNLKLQTSDGRLHVHVTEDVNEIIPYPPTSAIQHLDCQRFYENTICFDAHISGFVYKISVDGRIYIKKEIPGPNAVDEFLYEINALSSLQNSRSVIKFEGIIVDEKSEVIKGLLISYADQGALVDMIYDYKYSDELSWRRREHWARQIVEGLSEIHEAGFVQGDFTLSNIVIDHEDNAKIIDINRRGCPVGWEPPELAKLIESGQRISIYIGVKSDLYQLGMVLWALAEQQDEPERQERPLTRTFNQSDSDIPGYFKEIVQSCLSENPRERLSAKALLAKFPSHKRDTKAKAAVAFRDSISTHRSDKEYIDPATAVGLDDISQHRRDSRCKSSFENINMQSTEDPASSSSYILPNNHSTRGRSPDAVRSISRNGRSDFSPYPGHRSVMSLDDSELENELASLPASRETRWEQIYVDGDFKLVQRGGAGLDMHDFVTQDLKDVCITTRPDGIEASFMGTRTLEDPPLDLSVVTPSQPVSLPCAQPDLLEQRHKNNPTAAESKVSFSNHVRQLAYSQTQAILPNEAEPPLPRQSHIPSPTTLTNLEREIALGSSVSSSSAPSRTSTGFSIFDRPDPRTRTGTGFSATQSFHSPLHQDSGFAEPERVSYENERIQRSLDQSIRDLKVSTEKDKITGRLWDEKDDIMLEDVLGQPQAHISTTAPKAPVPVPKFEKPEKSNQKHSDGPSTQDMEQKPLEEKVSNNTTRPLIPEFGHSRTVDHSNMSSHEYTTSIIEPYNCSRSRVPTRRHLTNAPYLRDDPNEGSDLSDYLSHEIE